MTSSMAFQGASSSSSFPGPWKYDVYVSVEDNDFFFSFNALLHRSLRQNEITTINYVDIGGEENFYQAIEQSMISVVVFSENYVSSTWRLNELLKILDCKETKGQMVLPVFYLVDPSNVRREMNNFEETFARHEEWFKDRIKVQNWKAALTQLTNLPGLNLNYRGDSKLVRNIVREVLRIKNRTYFQVAKHPVGIESRVQEIKSLLSIDEMNEIRMVGILGAGGIGKTTIAKAIYNLMAYYFEGSCFLANVRENSSQESDLVKLQNTLLSTILGYTVEVDGVVDKSDFIKERLCSKRVLLILDDVDKSDQLDKLAGNIDWFGLGSRIIITTRYRDVLTSHGVLDGQIYEVKELDQDEALQLFCWNAFKGEKPIDEFLKLAEEAIHYIGRLPLDVISSDLYGEDIDTWRNKLVQFKSIPQGRSQKLHEVPRVSLSNSPSPLVEPHGQEPQPPGGNGEQGRNSSISRSISRSQGVILVLIGSVIGLLQLNDLFETHPANMWIAEAALIIFCMSYATMTKINGTRWARHFQIIDRFRILSGTLVAVSLLSIHLPHQLSWLFYVIWAFLVFIVVACTWIYPEGEGREVDENNN